MYIPEEPPPGEPREIRLYSSDYTATDEDDKSDGGEVSKDGKSDDGGGSEKEAKEEATDEDGKSDCTATGHAKTEEEEDEEEKEDADQGTYPHTHPIQVCMLA